MIKAIGVEFGDWVVVDEAGSVTHISHSGRKRTARLVKCRNRMTGEEKTVRFQNIRWGINKGVGCHKNDGCFTKKHLIEHLVGKRFNNLEILSEKTVGKQERKVLCRCDCGREKVITLSYVTSGKTRSCGCIARKIASDRMRSALNPSALNAGETSAREKKKKIGPELIRWRFKILNDNQFTCQKCGLSGDWSSDNFEAHHITPLSANFEKALDVDNGACLCAECHDEYHMKNGKKRAGFDSFHKWLAE